MRQVANFGARKRLRFVAGAVGVLGMLALTSCGVWQTTKDATASIGRAIFIAKVKEMNFVIESHDALNQNHDGRSLPLVLRFYQLKDSGAFEKASYAQLLDQDHELLKSSLAGVSEVTLAPGAKLTVSRPMADEAKFVGVVAFFRTQAGAEWQLVIPKAAWEKTDPVKLEVTGNRLEVAVQ
ncbi:type VI secretion system lipoprotein TssJ [Pandoraea sp.]|uniref:type VI secretion system lipoprotein TssJ n=1 Tax=Pandoraea sp. TaxID=1883445 RepID=UPI0035ADDB67